MKPYGLVKFGIRGCCPGHDDFPRETYKNKRSKRAHRKHTKIWRRFARRLARRLARKEIENASNNT